MNTHLGNKYIRSQDLFPVATSKFKQNFPSENYRISNEINTS